MTDGVGDVGAVVMATGSVVVLVGRVQVALHVAVGALVPAIEETLPFVERVPVFGSMWLLFVKVVADIATCQPAPVPVASLTVYCWSPATVSTMLWSRPLRVSLQVSDDGDVKVRLPPVTPSVPVRVQVVPAATAEPHGPALATPGVRAMRAGARPPVRTVRTASVRRERRITI